MGGGGVGGITVFWIFFVPQYQKIFVGGTLVIPKCSVIEKFMDQKGVITFFRWNFFLS